MSASRIDRAVRDAQLALELARMRKDRRAEGAALEALRAARTRQMKRDKRTKERQFAPEAIEAARALPTYDRAARRAIREALAAARVGGTVLAKAALVGLYLAGVGGLALGAQLILGA